MKLHLVMTLVVSLGLAASLSAADPLVGNWKLKKWTGSVRPYREWTVVYEEHEGQLVCSQTEIHEDGSLVLEKFTVPNTGGDVQILQGALALPLHAAQQRPA